MPEKKEEGSVDVQVTPTQESAKKDEINIDELRAELDALKKKSELSANEISTRDKKITDLSKEIKARMTEEERIKAESQSVLQELLEEFSTIASNSIGLDDKHKALIKGNTKDEIKASAELLKSYKESLVKDFEKQIKALTEENNVLKASGQAPKSGASPVPEGLQAQYDAAKKSGKADEMIAIIRAAKREAIEIKQ